MTVIECFLGYHSIRDTNASPWRPNLSVCGQPVYVPTTSVVAFRAASTEPWTELQIENRPPLYFPLPVEQFMKCIGAQVISASDDGAGA